MDRVAIREKLTNWIGKYKYFVLILLVGVVLMLIPAQTRKEATVTPTESTVTQPSVCEQLEDILAGIEGAGRVQVMLTYQTGEQVIYQTDKPGENREDTVIITNENRGQSGLVAQVISPTYRGAIILCQGAERASVCLAITEAVSKVTGLDTSQISVLKMK
ncbi:MAG: hypothetical protein E7454_02375 [Ruminococcaceae bacterium]|nr:hypothetical protein [Oscillospiraceae bacterium]